MSIVTALYSVFVVCHYYKFCYTFPCPSLGSSGGSTIWRRRYCSAWNITPFSSRAGNYNERLRTGLVMQLLVTDACRQAVATPGSCNVSQARNRQEIIFSGVCFTFKESSWQVWEILPPMGRGAVANMTYIFATFKESASMIALNTNN